MCYERLTGNLAAGSICLEASNASPPTAGKLSAYQCPVALIDKFAASFRTETVSVGRRRNKHLGWLRAARLASELPPGLQISPGQSKLTSEWCSTLNHGLNQNFEIRSCAVLPHESLSCFNSALQCWYRYFVLVVVVPKNLRKRNGKAGSAGTEKFTKTERKEQEDDFVFRWVFGARGLLLLPTAKVL